jgi:hypothetical protein
MQNLMEAEQIEPGRGKWLVYYGGVKKRLKNTDEGTRSTERDFALSVSIMQSAINFTGGLIETAAQARRIPASKEARSIRGPRLSDLASKIESFSNLPADWAGSDTVPVPADLVKHLKAIIGALPEAVPVPQAVPSADGEVALVWFRNGGRLEAMFSPDGYFSWVHTGAVDKKIIDGETTLDNPSVLTLLTEALESFFS